MAIGDVGVVKALQNLLVKQNAYEEPREAIRSTVPTASTVTAPAQTAVGTTAGEILVANTNRRGLMVQNTGTTVIKLSLGTTDPTQTAYHIALKAGSAANDGLGGVYIDDQWLGAVRAISSAAGGTIVITETS